jgi:hypothetical protein
LQARNQSLHADPSSLSGSGPHGDPALCATREILRETMEAHAKNKAGDNIALALGLIPGA